MAWITNNTKTATIANYKKFYIQGASDTTASDTMTTWGLIAKTNPYDVMPKPKEPYKNDWKDRDGDDEYVSEMYYEPLEIKVGFYAKAPDAATLRQWMDAFFNKIKQGTFKIYDEYTALGFMGVRYAGYEKESYNANASYASTIFTVTFKVNAPTTHCVMLRGSIVAPLQNE